MADVEIRTRLLAIFCFSFERVDACVKSLDDFDKTPSAGSEYLLRVCLCRCGVCVKGRAKFSSSFAASYLVVSAVRDVVLRPRYSHKLEDSVDIVE